MQYLKRCLLNYLFVQKMSYHVIDKLDVHEVQVLFSTIIINSSARDLGISHWQEVDDVRSCYVGLTFSELLFATDKIDRAVTQSLTVNAARMLVQAHIASRLDYCNAALHGITDNLLQWLQSVQNAAARLVTRTGRCELITPFYMNYTGCQYDAMSSSR